MGLRTPIFVLLSIAATYCSTSIAQGIDENCENLQRIALDDNQGLERQLAALEAYERNCVGNADFVPAIAGVSSFQLEPLKQELEAQKSFLGLKFGVGLGFSVSQDSAVDSAVIVDGKIVATSNREQLPRVLLEFHKYFEVKRETNGTTHGFGPFIAVAAANDNLLSGVGLGVMYGIKSEVRNDDGFSVGLGAILDGGVKDLAKGFNVGEELPQGETIIRFNEESRWSTILFFTRTF